MKTHEHSLKGWIPYKLIIENNTPLVQWLYISGISFDRPFFDETIIQCKQHPYNSSPFKCISSIENMIEWSETFSEMVSVTFIFHISRCGSTLLSQLIGLDSKYVVLAEVPFFDEILRLPYKLKNISKQLQNKALQAAIKLVGQNSSKKPQHLFIKTDSWHISFHKTLRQLYPTAAFILLYRSPDEVVYSHQKLRGMQSVPGLIEPEVFRLTQIEIANMTLDIYTAKILEKYMLLFEEIVNHDSQSLLLNYKQGAISMIKQLGEYLNIEWSKEHLLQMQDRSHFHSKHPQQNFNKEIKSNYIPEFLQDVMKLYNQLDKKRNADNLYST